MSPVLLVSLKRCLIPPLSLAYSCLHCTVTRPTRVCRCTQTGSLSPLTLPSLYLSPSLSPVLISGWWYVEDLHGRSGWAPASFLKPVLDKGHQKNRDVVGKCPGWRPLEVQLCGLLQLTCNLSSCETFVPVINISIIKFCSNVVFSQLWKWIQVRVVFWKRKMKWK